MFWFKLDDAYNYVKFVFLSWHSQLAHRVLLIGNTVWCWFSNFGAARETEIIASIVFLFVSILHGMWIIITWFRISTLLITLALKLITFLRSVDWLISKLLSESWVWLVTLIISSVEINYQRWLVSLLFYGLVNGLLQCYIECSKIISNLFK